MPDTLIRLCYRKVIDANSQQVWEKHVFESTYTEFLMQAQLYNQEKKYPLYSELVHHVANARKINFLVSAAVIGYLKQLDGIVPDIRNALGKLFLPFKGYQFEMIESDMTNQAMHRVAIGFISEPLLWLDTVNDYFLVAQTDKKEGWEEGKALLTEMIPIVPFLGIYSISKDITGSNV